MEGGEWASKPGCRRHNIRILANDLALPVNTEEDLWKRRRCCSRRKEAPPVWRLNKLQHTQPAPPVTWEGRRSGGDLVASRGQLASFAHVHEQSADVCVTISSRIPRIRTHGLHLVKNSGQHTSNYISTQTTMSCQLGPSKETKPQSSDNCVWFAVSDASSSSTLALRFMPWSADGSTQESPTMRTLSTLMHDSAASAATAELEHVCASSSAFCAGDEVTTFATPPSTQQAC